MIKTRKRSQVRYVAQLTVLAAFVVIVGGTTVGLTITQAIKTRYTMDTVIISIYLICMLALWQLVVWLTPARKRERR